MIEILVYDQGRWIWHPLHPALGAVLFALPFIWRFLP